MPIFDLFYKPSLHLSPTVSPLQIIESSHHNNLMLENRNQNLYTENNADTSTGGVGIESHYIANNAITSSKIDLQIASVTPANRIYQHLASIAPAGGSWNSNTFAPNGFAQFTINWERPFMTAEIDFIAYFSAKLPRQFYQAEMTTKIELWALVSSVPTLITFMDFEDILEVNERHYMPNHTLSTPSGQANQVIFKSCTAKFLYSNTVGSAFTNFFFKANGFNLSYTDATPSLGSLEWVKMAIRQLTYKTYGNIHS